MATLEENKNFWQTKYDWSSAGDEWSAPWGGTQNLWEYVVYPRIKEYLPVRNIVEIAPGFGRWTQYLQQYCDRLVSVDLSANCVESCRERFAKFPHIQILQNDGLSIPILEDSSIDFVFSFDSLVHVEADVLQSYLKEIARVLRPNGKAFIHHSNLGTYRSLLKFGRRLPNFASEAATRANLLPVPHWRGESVTAEWVASESKRNGLSTIRQELISWRNHHHLIDCLTTLEQSELKDTLVLRNPKFMEEAERIRSAHASDNSSARATVK